MTADINNYELVNRIANSRKPVVLLQPIHVANSLKSEISREHERAIVVKEGENESFLGHDSTFDKILQEIESH